MNGPTVAASMPVTFSLLKNILFTSKLQRDIFGIIIIQSEDYVIVSSKQKITYQ